MSLESGITGGIGSGKSVVARIFACLGIPVYEADRHAKRLMTTDGNLVSSIRAEFGDLSYTVDGALNREHLAAAVFPSPDRLKRLNALVHPVVAADYARWRQAWSGRVPYTLKEAALLLDAAAQPFGGQVIVVTAPEHLRLERVVKRDKRKKEDIHQIMMRQMSEQEMSGKADFVIQNDGIRALIPQVLHIHATLLRSIAPERKS